MQCDLCSLLSLLTLETVILCLTRCIEVAVFFIAYFISILNFWLGDSYPVIPSLWYLVSSNILRNCCFQLMWVVFCNLVALFRYSDSNCRQFAGRNKAARTSAVPWGWGSPGHSERPRLQTALKQGPHSARKMLSCRSVSPWCCWDGVWMGP